MAGSVDLRPIQHVVDDDSADVDGHVILMERMPTLGIQADRCIASIIPVITTNCDCSIDTKYIGRNAPFAQCNLHTAGPLDLALAS